MTREELRHDFHNEQGINWENSQGEPDIDYVMWLENKILAVRNNTPLPPAEGAEAILKEGLDDGRYADIVDGINIDVKQPFYQAIIRYAEDVVAAQQQPTAEGAEQRIRVRNILQDFYRRGEYELEQAEEDIMRLFQPQPTAEGAEEILTKHLGSLMPLKYGVKYNKTIDAMREFATLHAQRIADKMVNERMKKAESLLNMAAGLVGNPCTNISSSCDIACDDWQGEYNEYLKSKEK